MMMHRCLKHFAPVTIVIQCNVINYIFEGWAVQVLGANDSYICMNTL